MNLENLDGARCKELFLSQSYCWQFNEIPSKYLWNCIHRSLAFIDLWRWNFANFFQFAGHHQIVYDVKRRWQGESNFRNCAARKRPVWLLGNNIHIVIVKTFFTFWSIGLVEVNLQKPAATFEPWSAWPYPLALWHLRHQRGHSWGLTIGALRPHSIRPQEAISSTMLQKGFKFGL